MDKRIINKIIDFCIVFFLGVFGVHKFIKGETKMGFFYLFTMGGFGILWIVDMIKVLIGRGNRSIMSNSLMSSDDLSKIKNGILPEIISTNLNLAEDESCCYADQAYTFTDKTVTTGYTGKRNGMSFKLSKNISYHTGGSDSKAIRETQRTKYYGMLYLTTKRIIYTSQKVSFDKTFDKITSIQEAKDGVIVQIGSSTYSIVTKTHSEFMKVFNLLK